MWGVWAALTVATIGLVLARGVDVPYMDEWGDILPVYAGVRPLDVDWLWKPHFEHRVPLSRLILLGLGYATDFDFRAGAVFNALALSAASAFLLRVVRGVNGRLQLADCALPLLLLGWSQYMTLLWSYQVHATLLVLFVSALLALLMRHPETPSMRVIVTFGACLLALPLCQAAGVALAPVLALWCVVVGVGDLRSSETGRRLRGWVALAFAAAAVVLAAVTYLPPSFSTSGDPLRVLWWSEVMLSTGFGMTERQSLLPTLLLPVATAALMLATGVLLLRVMRAQPPERLRALGLGLFLLAFQALAIGIGWGRQAGALGNRYPVLAAPCLCAVYLVWRRYGPGRSGALVCAALCATLVLLMPWNTAGALRFARTHGEKAAAFERDVRSGMPVDELAARYTRVYHPRKGVLRKFLRMMHDAELSAFRPRERESP